MQDPTNAKPDMYIEATVAAQWWADQMLAAQADLATQVGAEDDDPVRAPTASLMMALAQAEDRVDCVVQVDAFRDALRDEVLMRLDRHPNLTIGVDYGPDAIFHDAAKTAGIQLGMTSLPWKTVMWIAPGSVRVSKGYGAEVIDLPLSR